MWRVRRRLASPGSIGFHYGVIQADGEKDQFVLLAFLLQRRFNFLFHSSGNNGTGIR